MEGVNVEMRVPAAVKPFGGGAAGLRGVLHRICIAKSIVWAHVRAGFARVMHVRRRQVARVEDGRLAPVSSLLIH